MKKIFNNVSQLYIKWNEDWLFLTCLSDLHIKNMNIERAKNKCITF